MFKIKFFSLQYKFMIISLSITIIPILTVGGLSYVKSISIINEKISESNYNTVKQIADNINLVLKDMVDSSDFLCQNKEFMSKLRLPKSDITDFPNTILSARNSVNSFVAFKTYIYSIYVQSFNGLIFDSANTNNSIDSKLQTELINLRGESKFIPDTITNYDNSKTKVISLVKLFKDPDMLSSNLAFIKINISEEQISKIFKRKSLGNKGDCFVIDDQKKIISSINNKMLGIKLDSKFDEPRLYKDTQGYYTSLIDNQYYLVTYVNLPLSNWKLVNLVQLSELSHDTQIIKLITFFSIIVSFTLSMIMILFFSLKILSPLKEIRKSMKYLEKENFDVSINVKGNDEIALLGKSFNAMSKKLNELIHEVYIQQIKQKDAELRALQAQINPHFLYNTLSTIYWMCRTENAIESSHLVSTLSKLFRLSLSSGNEFTTVNKELEHLNLYITIQQKRFADMIEFNVHYSENLLECKVVKLILQPLVENAIHHGIEKKGTKGTIDISVYKEGQYLIYTIIDNGAGADENELNLLLKNVESGNRGFGIKNVNDRIKLCFGDEYGLHFKTSPMNGTKAIVKQPYILEE